MADNAESVALRLAMPESVQSVVRARTNGPLIAAAAELWIEADDVVLDVTYGQGAFWTVVRPERLVAHDIELDGVDFRVLPEPDASVDVVVFDPPYIAQGGRETSSTVPGFTERYGLLGAPRNVAELEATITAGITEAGRVLRPGGRLLVKCCDYVNGRRFVAGRHHVVSTAAACELEQVDELVHLSGPGPTSRGPEVRQQHSRRVHSYLCVFRKRVYARRRR